MAAANLKLVEGTVVDSDRQKALDAALAQIDRAFEGLLAARVFRRCFCHGRVPCDRAVALP